MVPMIAIGSTENAGIISNNKIRGKSIRVDQFFSYLYSEWSHSC